MKHFITLLTVISAFWITSCQSGKILETTATGIPLLRDSSCFYKAWTIYENNEGIFFLAKITDKDTLLIFKESDKNFIFLGSKALPSTYIDTMKDEMNSDKFQLIPISLDTIIIFTRHTISMLDLKKDTMLKHYAFNHDSEKIVIVDRAGPLRWNSERKVLPVMIVRFDDESCNWDWDTEFAAEFSIETGKLNIIPVTYPKERCYTNKLISGFHPNPLITYGEEKYMLGFQGSPTVFVHDIRNGRTDSVHVKNPLYKPFPDYYDTLKLVGDVAYLKQMMRSATYDFYYTELVYDPYKKFFYRFFMRDMTEKDSQGRTNEFRDKEIGFSVFTATGKIVGDAHWPMKEVSSSAWYTTSKGIYGFTHGCIGKQCTNKWQGNVIRINWKQSD